MIYLDWIETAGAGGAPSGSYNVSGAGDATYNGAYLANGTYNGAPLFTFGASRNLFWNSLNSHWVLGDGTFSTGSSARYYSSAAGQSTAAPATTSWQFNTGFANGPAPTVALS